MKRSDQIKKYILQLKDKEIEIIKDLGDLLNSEKLKAERLDFDIKFISTTLNEIYGLILTLDP